MGPKVGELLFGLDVGERLGSALGDWDAEGPLSPLLDSGLVPPPKLVPEGESLILGSMLVL